MNVTLTPHGIELLQAAHERHHLSPAEIVELALAGRFGPEPEQPMSRMRSPEEIFAEAPALYPEIEICEGAEAQFVAMTGTERYFGWVLEALAACNREVLAWTEGPFPHVKLPGPASGESPAVRNSAQMMRMRYFRCHGEELLFEYHMKQRGQNIRMHYRVDPDRRLLMVGYVGHHLPTALY